MHPPGFANAERIGLEPRPCACCGEERLTPLREHDAGAHTRAGPRLFEVRVALCPACALVQASPAPSQDALLAHYRDSFARFTGQALDFSVEARLRLLRRHAAGRERFVEVGGNATGPFTAAATELFGAAPIAVEPNAAAESEHDRLGQLAAGGADVLAHYFVLEHVRDLRGFLDGCRRALADDGVMVCEVPDLGLYPRDPAGLLLHEHMNHFTPQTLARAAAGAGLRPVEVSHADCSRGFGFAAVLAPAEGVPEPPRVSDAELASARSCVAAGAALIEAYWDSLDEGRRRIEQVLADGGEVVAWAANDVLSTLAERADERLLDRISVVDSDPAKRDWFGDRSVLTPEAARAALERADLFVACSPQHVGAIAARVTELTSRPVDPRAWLVLGPSWS